MTDPGTTLGDLIHQRTADLTTAERRVARTLFASNLMAGFDTVAGLAPRLGVSGPTVLRFASKIGFAGYADFQRALESDVAARIDSPLRLQGRSPPEQCRDHLLDIAGDSFINSVKSTFANLPRGEFDGVVALLADRRRTVYTSGGALHASLRRDAARPSLRAAPPRAPHRLHPSGKGRCPARRFSSRRHGDLRCAPLSEGYNRSRRGRQKAGCHGRAHH